MLGGNPMEEDKHLALELLQEVKASQRRWFIMAVVELIVIVTLILILLLVPADSVSIENEDGNANYIGNDMNGDINNGKDYGEEVLEGQTDNN